MSVVFSNTLIFGPECWKCILRGPDSKCFQGELPQDPHRNLRLQRLQVVPVVQVFSISAYSKAFATYL